MQQCEALLVTTPEAAAIACVSQGVHGEVVHGLNLPGRTWHVGTINRDKSMLFVDKKNVVFLLKIVFVIKHQEEGSDERRGGK